MPLLWKGRSTELEEEEDDDDEQKLVVNRNSRRCV